MPEHRGVRLEVPPSWDRRSGIPQAISEGELQYCAFRWCDKPWCEQGSAASCRFYEEANRGNLFVNLPHRGNKLGYAEILDGEAVVDHLRLRIYGGRSPRAKRPIVEQSTV